MPGPSDYFLHPAERFSPLAQAIIRACPDPALLLGDTYGLRRDLPVSGRVTHFLPFWEKITSDQWVLEVVTRGYRLDFEKIPPFSGLRNTFLRSGQSTLSEEVEGLLEKCAVEPVPPGQEMDGFYSTYFLIPKKDGGIRPILNLKRFNVFLRKHKFKMESLQSIIPVMCQGQWMASIDLKDAYFHIPILQDHWKYLRFLFEGRAFQFKVTPFGLSLAPMLFTRVLLVIIAWLRAQGVLVHVYLDDLLIVGATPPHVHQSLRLVLATLTYAGFIVNLKKSDLTPVQDLVYIGGRFCTNVSRVFLPENRRSALCRAVQVFMKVGTYLQARLWLQLLGLMAATIPSVAQAHLRMRPFQWYLKSKWRASIHSLNHLVMVPASLLPCCQWWLVEENLSQGRPFQEPTPTVTVTTDASQEGWGGHSSLGGSDMLFSGLWNRRQKHLHINVLELRAVFLTVLNLQSRLKGQVVQIECDNSTAVAYINHQGGTRSWSLNQQACQLHEWALANQIQLQAVHRPGLDNVLADYLSRNRPDPTEWALNPQVCRKLFQLWGRPQVDLFATLANHQLPLWFSRNPDQGAVAVNALSQTWTGWSVYAFPPINLIMRTLLKVRDEKVEEAILVVPYWPRKPWFPLLLQMAVDRPVLFRKRIDLLSQKLAGAGVLYHQDLATLRLAAWKLSGVPGAQRGFPKLSSPQRAQLRDSQPELVTMASGRTSATGALNGASIQFVLL